MTIENSKGTVWYGLHMYPGVAEYRPADKEMFRVFLNEATIRSMDPTFAGCPVFVMHVDKVEPNLEKLRAEADGWVVESFFNQADGKHWAKFIIVSEQGNRSIKRGMRLSNSYAPKSFAPGGMWNGLDYDREVKDGEYRHLAIVPDPRYEESFILTPDEFKKYNEEKLNELQLLANNKDKESKVKFSFFKREEIKNSSDLEAMMVTLPKSKYEGTVASILNAMDEAKVAEKETRVVNGDDMMDYDGEAMSFNSFMEKHKAMRNELAELKAKHEEGDEHKNAADEAKKKEAEEAAAKDLELKNAADAKAKKEADDKKAVDKKKADELRNARDKAPPAPGKIDTMEDGLERGAKRYGSGT